MGTRPYPYDGESAHIGAQLRAARESTGQTIEDAAAATKVQARYLRAIEALDKEALPSIGYMLGYVRTYALHLGLPAQETIAQFKTDIECPARLGIAGSPHHVPKRKWRMPRGSLGALTALSCAAVVVTWYGWQSDANSEPSPPITMTANVAPIEQPQIQPRQDAADVISLKAIGPSWVEVRSESGLVLAARMMVPGEIFETSLAQNPTVSLRDAGAIELYVSGAAKGTLGRKGQSLKGHVLLPNSEPTEQ